MLIGFFLLLRGVKVDVIWNNYLLCVVVLRDGIFFDVFVCFDLLFIRFICWLYIYFDLEILIKISNLGDRYY